MGDRVISNELIEQFCRSVYSLGFVDNAAPIANNLLATPEAKLNKERVRNNLQMYFGDSFEDKEQVSQASVYVMQIGVGSIDNRHMLL